MADDSKDKRDPEDAADAEAPGVDEGEERVDGELPADPEQLARTVVAEEMAGGGEADEDELLPAQLAHRRYVYAVFFALGITVAYFTSRASLALWHRLSQWTPKVGEPREDLVTPAAAVLAAIVTFLVYRREDVRVLSDEVAL